MELHDYAHLERASGKGSWKRPVKIDNINQDTLCSWIANLPPPILDVEHLDVEQEMYELIETLYHASKNSQSRLIPNIDQTLSRWQNLLRVNDSKTIWKAISWKGTIDPHNHDTPDDQAFKEHYENLLFNPDKEDINTCDTTTCPNIPVLDDPISVREVQDAISRLKPNKSCGPDGISPGILRLLPVTWILYITALLSVIFQKGISVMAWNTMRLVSIFKSGSRSVCNNYRGIAVASYMFKLFDIMLYNHLSQWYRPCREQAGCQKGRGCLEQILTLRLIIDFCKKRKYKLFLLFINFSKAYDKVPRSKLIQELHLLGCGGIMLGAIIALYSSTKFILRSAVISFNTGVLQGASTSGFLFVLYLDRMIHMIKREFDNDGFLGALNMLLLMDDTVILATSRDKLAAKLSVVMHYCEQYGMVVNEKKTKFMVINSDEREKNSIQYHGLYGHLEVKYSDSYTYLGSPITDDGKISTAIKLHAAASEKHLNKFITFIHRNPDLPFTVKRQIMDACFVSSIIYAGEGWFGGQLKPLETLYIRAIKCLLNVRITTCTDMCLLELNQPSLNTLLLKRRSDFLKRKIPSLHEDDPLKLALDLGRSANTRSYKAINTAFNLEHDIIHANLQKQRETLEAKYGTSSKRAFYRIINPTGSPHYVYTLRDNCVPEHTRTAFTRLRLVSHNLRIETGRWARLERDRRTCTCDNTSVQDEAHALFHCPRTQHLRQIYGLHDFAELFSCETPRTLCNFIYEALKCHEKI
jgi:hypothetical protein